METVEVNGVKYSKIEKTPNKYVNKRILPILGIMGMFGGVEYGRRQGNDGGVPDKKIDIVKEYELIQLKKSNLSRSQREWAVRQFEKNYQKIEE
jgi:hypothetical protein